MAYIGKEFKKECISCLTLCDAMDCSPPGSSVLGILQTRILECIAISFSKGSFQPRDGTWVSCIAGRFFTIWATGKPYSVYWVWKCESVSHSVVSNSATPWTVAHQVSLSMEFSRQEYWSELPCPVLNHVKFYWASMSVPVPCYMIYLHSTMKN